MKKDKSNGKNGNDGSYRKHTSHSSHNSHNSQNADRLLQPRGDYQTLLSFQKAEIVYDITFRFVHKFLAKGDRTVNQMIQSARSGKKNILEGSKAALTSKETEIKLTTSPALAWKNYWTTTKITSALATWRFGTKIPRRHDTSASSAAKRHRLTNIIARNSPTRGDREYRYLPYSPNQLSD